MIRNSRIAGRGTGERGAWSVVPRAGAGARAARRSGYRDPYESLRSMNPESESLIFWRFRFMTPSVLEIQIHESLGA